MDHNRLCRTAIIFETAQQADGSLAADKCTCPCEINNVLVLTHAQYCRSEVLASRGLPTCSQRLMLQLVAGASCPTLSTCLQHRRHVARPVPVTLWNPRSNYTAGRSLEPSTQSWGLVVQLPSTCEAQSDETQQGRVTAGRRGGETTETSQAAKGFLQRQSLFHQAHPNNSPGANRSPLAPLSHDFSRPCRLSKTSCGSNKQPDLFIPWPKLWSEVSSTSHHELQNSHHPVAACPADPSIHQRHLSKHHERHFQSGLSKAGEAPAN